MPLVLRGALDPDLAQGDDSDAEHLYEAVGEAIRASPQTTMIDLLGAIQRGDPWPRLPAHVRAVFSSLAEQVFAEED